MSLGNVIEYASLSVVDAVVCFRDTWRGGMLDGKSLRHSSICRPRSAFERDRPSVLGVCEWCAVVRAV